MSQKSNKPSLTDFDSLWNFSDPAATEQRFRELLPAAEASNDASYRSQLLTQIARAQGLQREFELAHATLDQVHQRVNDAAAVVRVRYLLERGRVYNSSKQTNQARPLFMEAWEAAQLAGEDGYAVDAAHMMAIVEQDDESLRWNEKAVALAERSSDPRARKWLGSLYNNIGWTYHSRSDFSAALEMFKKALAEREKQEDAELIRVARWCIARTLRSLGRVEEALSIQEQLLSENEREGRNDGYVFEELAECHLALDHADDAKKYFALAHGELSKDAWLAESEPQRLARLKQLANNGETA